MEYAKDEIFQIRYHTDLNRLEMRKDNWTSRLGKRMKRHKLLTVAIVSLCVFATVNIIMIGSFMRILQNL
ncbi:MAG: hypothetical protein HFJ34_01115 [Clostridia bacterium]|nr:hypothetical protein [Clostridia bacterium]